MSMLKAMMMANRGGDTTDYKALWVARLSGTLSGEVIIPPEVTALANQALVYNLSITSIKTTATQQVGESIVTTSTRLSLVDLCADTTKIGWHAFYTIVGSLTVVCRATTPPTLFADAFGSTLTAIQVPSASVSAYKAAANWSNYASIITAIDE